MSEGEAAAIYRLMDNHHQQNRGDIEELKTDVRSLRASQDRQTGMLEGIVMAIKSARWILLVIGALLTLWLTSLEIRHYLADNRVEQPSPPKQHADTPRDPYER